MNFQLEEDIECRNLLKLAFENQDQTNRISLFREVLKISKNNGDALLQIGLYELQHNQDLGFSLLEKLFDKSTIPNIPLNTSHAKVLSGLIARYNIERHKYILGEKFLNISLECCSYLPNLAQQIQKTTLITGYPNSILDAKKIINNFHSRIDVLLQEKNLDLTYVNDEDPYLFCMLTMFYVEIYHEVDIKSIMCKFYKLAIKLFPTLNYTSPNINKLTIKKNKYTIGIVSAFFCENSSVDSDFQAVIHHLPKNTYNIYYIYFSKFGNMSKSLENKTNVLLYNTNDIKCLEKARLDIEKLDLDLLLYLDSTMSTYCHRMLMSKLAKVQAVTHGHPVTSGVDRNIVDFYVSWEAAELEYDSAQNHYTEELLLLPKSGIHQYYNNRVSNGYSLINNMKYKDLTRNDFSNIIPIQGNWYLCMQKPFKRHPEFDKILNQILEKDKQAHIILHGGENSEIDKIFIDRFRRLNMDLDRIHLINEQPHHRLMALYTLSDVILDSYYAGGCTTTREALEVGAVVVTLPTNYLGGRWSLAYYSIIGVMDTIAKSESDYVDIAIKLGKSKEYQTEMKNKILKNVNKIFHQKQAIYAWDSILKRMISKHYNNNK